MSSSDLGGQKKYIQREILRIAETSYFHKRQSRAHSLTNVLCVWLDMILWLTDGFLAVSVRKRVKCKCVHMYECIHIQMYVQIYLLRTEVSMGSYAC